MDFSRTFPAEARALRPIRRAVRDAARESGAGDGLVDAAVTAVHEAAANAVIQGYDGGPEEGSIGLEDRDGDGWLRFTVSDMGSGCRLRRRSPGSGLGLALICQLADDFELRDRPGVGVVVQISVRL